MNLTEALKAMKDGHDVKHPFYTGHNVSATIENNHIKMSNGSRITLSAFMVICDPDVYPNGWEKVIHESDRSQLAKMNL